jgi:GDP/UDP-N,N'-diacetylbacillosamine 2-epimerase (hydrolysing)
MLCKKIFLPRQSSLVTFHPETVSLEQNHASLLELLNWPEILSFYVIVITMPNADTLGSIYRRRNYQVEK